MKFLHYIALIGGAMAVNLHQRSAIHLATPPQKTLIMSKLKNMIKDDEPHPEGEGDERDFWHDFEEWGNGELADGGTVTKAEAKDFIKNYAKDRGIEIPQEAWEQLENLFDYVDTNGDGHIDQAEVNALEKAHEDVEWPTQDELIAWVEGEISRDGNITWDELEFALDQWAESQAYEVPDVMRKALHQGFEAVDKNGDGKVVTKELQEAFGNHEHSDHHRDQEGHQNDGPSEEEIKAYLYGLIDADGDITLQELYDDADQYAADHNLGEVPQEVKDDLMKNFEEADTNGDGKVVKEELDYAMARHERKKNRPKGPKKD